jgi:hypothetical protein
MSGLALSALEAQAPPFELVGNPVGPSPPRDGSREDVRDAFRQHRAVRFASTTGIARFSPTGDF